MSLQNLFSSAYTFISNNLFVWPANSLSEPQNDAPKVSSIIRLDFTPTIDGKKVVLDFDADSIDTLTQKKFTYLFKMDQAHHPYYFLVVLECQDNQNSVKFEYCDGFSWSRKSGTENITSLPHAFSATVKKTHIFYRKNKEGSERKFKFLGSSDQKERISFIDTFYKIKTMSVYNLGKSSGMYALGKYYLEGKEVDQNLEKSLKYFKEASQIYAKHTKKEQKKISRWYRLQDGIPDPAFHEPSNLEDPNKPYPVIEIANKIADTYDKMALRSDTKQNLENALEYFKEMGCTKRIAYFSEKMAIYYHELAIREGKRYGAEKQIDNVLYYRTEAAKLGNQEAAYNLGNHYYEGDGVIRQIETAIKWWEKAAVQNFGPALCMLGKIYASGEVVVNNSCTPMQYFYRGARSKHAESCYLYSKALQTLGTVLIRDELRSIRLGEDTARHYRSLAIDLLESDLEKGDQSAQYLLGNMRMEWGNIKDAIRLWKLSADSGHVKAQCRLADYHYSRYEYTQAFEYWKSASAKDDGEAQLQLGYCYYYGYGVEIDLLKSESFYLSAAKKGHFPKGILSRILSVFTTSLPGSTSLSYEVNTRSDIYEADGLEYRIGKWSKELLGEQRIAAGVTFFPLRVEKYSFHELAGQN